MGMKGARSYSEDASEAVEYEKLRNARLLENRKRMEDLGLKGLAQQLKESSTPPLSASRPSSRLRDPPSHRLPAPVGPSRRSSRLQGGPVVSYAENRKEGIVKGKKSAERRASEAGRGGYQPEIYTEEHEKLLGSATNEWQLFVDGYSNGTRVYDPVRGKTCHQCRQKTMGQRTRCSSCDSLRGQFCGDCLYMRYGENVCEALANKKWVCPVCRHICNCSFCRLHRGWTPTGPLYKRIKSLGYKSVAHYLILTRRGGDCEETATLQKTDVKVIETPKPEKTDVKVIETPKPEKAVEVEAMPKVPHTLLRSGKKVLKNEKFITSPKEESTSLSLPKPDAEKGEISQVRDTEVVVVSTKDGLQSLQV